MQELWTQLGAPVPLASVNSTQAFQLRADGWKVAKGNPLFPKDVSEK
jgi:hypothetical protein